MKKVIFIISFSVMVFVLCAGLFAARTHEDEYYNQANNVIIMLKEGNVNGSVSALKDMTADFGEDDFIRTAYGINMLLGGQKEEARKFFEYELSLNSKDRYSNYCMGILNFSEKKVNGALEYFRKAGDNINDIKTFVQYASVVSDRNSRISPTEEETFNSIVFDGYFELRNGNYENARKFFELVSDIKKENSYVETKGFLLSYDFNEPISFCGDRFGETLGLHVANKNKKKTVSGNVTVRADMSNIRGVKILLFYIDDNFKGMSNSSSLTFDSSPYANGLHDIRIDAIDYENNLLSSTNFTIDIFNRQNAPIFFDDEVMWKELWDFIQIKPSQAAVNYLTAVCDSKLKDTASHLYSLEKCVACNPNYRDAKKILKKNYIKGNGIGELDKIITPKKKVCITFDDGPTETTRELLDVLRSYNAKATFFVVGKMAVKYPEIIKEIKDQGHQVALHSQNHYNLTRLNYDELQSEVMQGFCSVKSCDIEPSFYLRPPGGNLNHNIKLLAQDYGINIVMWTKNTTHLQQSSPEEMAEYCNNSLKPGFIYLMHNNVPVTVKALPMILSHFRAMGYECVTLEEILKKN